MDTQKRQQWAQKIETGMLFIWGATFLLFPLLFTTYTTDAFVLPKELLLAFVVLLSLLGWGIQMILQSQVRIRRTPLDVPIILLTVAVILSSVFSANRSDSLIAAAGVVFAALAYFVLVNVFRTRKVAFFLLSSLLTGGILTTIVTILSHYKVYVLPFAIAKAVTFTPLGTYTEFALVAVILLPLTFAFLMPAAKKQLNARVGVFAVAALILVAGLALIGRDLATVQKPVILSFDAGFQTAFAAISQDSGRVLQTFLFGEGYGTFASVFARFHNAAFNANQQMWFLAFNNSSSFVLELLATTGLVGVLSYIFLIFKALTPVAKKKTNPFYITLIVTFILSVIVPFSFVEISLLFLLLAGFSLAQREHAPHEYFDFELKLVALKKGVLAFTTLEQGEAGRKDSHPTPILTFVIFLAVIVVLCYYTTRFVISDVLFQQSIVAATANNGTATYRLQSQAINTFPYRSDYYRLFSQTNIALANSLLALNNGKPNTTEQQAAFTLIQQAIATAKQATVLAPQSPIAWQNLSSVYRALIGVGQNAQDFAIQSAQQATVLDPANPQEYLNLGGLYYQIGQYDNAIVMFQRAVGLKNDYANAYYNLGHAYEQKGDLQNALAQYQIVQNLVANDKANEERITQEITALQAKIGKQPTQQTTTEQSTGQQQPLALPTSTQLPQQQQQVPLTSPTPGK